jgi:hypothetical protein
MASAWGSSWGNAWGNSWGEISSVIQDSWGDSWGDSWSDSWGHVTPPSTIQDSWGDSWGCSWFASWGHQGCVVPPPTPTRKYGMWAEDDTDWKRIKRDERDFLNILIMVIHGMNGKL